jgi:DNA repair exonuclease SbcCD ATPase subunit
MFSYGKDNSISLNNNKITQLTAVNGSGKSSIALILQEILFNKNVKNIKKGDVLNRWSNSKSWSGSVLFTTDGTSYEVSVSRTGASTKVKLFEDGIDISEHKVLDTYKKINDIIGLDFEVFSQLTYQSSTDLLDFLKATDANRKKFLINLFNLEKYLEIGDQIKLKAAEVDREISTLNGELKSIEDYLNNTAVPEPKQEQELPIIDDNIVIRISEIDNELTNINEISSRIDKNNMYIAERDALVFDVSLQEPDKFTEGEALDEAKFRKKSLESEISRITKEKSSIKILDKCPSCGQSIDNNHLIAMKNRLDEELVDKQSELEKVASVVSSLQNAYNEYQQAEARYNKNKESISRFEQLAQLINSSIPTEFPDANKLRSEKSNLQATLTKQQKALEEAINHNKGVSAHNAKREAIKEQISDFKVRQTKAKDAILEKSDVASSLTILKKAFSTSGIVAFKLESLTKELETTINSYLASLSDGQFQVEFSLDKEKLNISVINNGIKSPIETMSGGEFSRVQTSILLAIRNLLSKLGGSSVNLLFLDEITGVLDEEGKDKLIEVLQEEEDLNVFLISHDFTHPLIDKINIIKENNISRINV